MAFSNVVIAAKKVPSKPTKIQPNGSKFFPLPYLEFGIPYKLIFTQLCDEMQLNSFTKPPFIYQLNSSYLHRQIILTLRFMLTDFSAPCKLSDAFCLAHKPSSYTSLKIFLLARTSLSARTLFIGHFSRRTLVHIKSLNALTSNSRSICMVVKRTSLLIVSRSLTSILTFFRPLRQLSFLPPLHLGHLLKLTPDLSKLHAQIKSSFS